MSKPDGFDGALVDLFRYYLECTGKNGKIYRLTPARKAKGLARLHYCHQIAREPKEENTIGLFRLAIERFTSDPFHRGENQDHKPYLDWELLCRSDEKFMHWLDDTNFKKGAA